MSEAPERGSRAGKNRKKKTTRPARTPQYWMIVSSPENYRKTQERGFTVQGIKSRHRKRAEVMKPGDRLLFYVTGRMVFTATCTLTSGVFEDHTYIWRS